MKKQSISDICRLLAKEEIQIKGDPRAGFSVFSPLDNAQKNSLSFCSYQGEAAVEALKKTKAAVIFCRSKIDFPVLDGVAYLLVDNPRLCFAKIVAEYGAKPLPPKIDSRAIIGACCRMGKISVGPYAIIGDNVAIGDGSSIAAGAIIADNVIIGKNVTIKSNAVIGQKGFGFEFEKDGTPFEIPHIGAVVIGNNVEIGANSTICRGTLRDTVVSDFAKIDDNVFIAHNVWVGPRTLVIAGAEISGSAHIGADCWLAPNCSIRDNISIGNNVLIGLGAVVTKSIPDGVVAAGNPARIIRKNEPRINN